MSNSARGQLTVLGGTFDPPHLGHLALASMALAQLDLEKVFFVLTPDPPHKQDSQISPVADRLAMLKLAIANQPSFDISRVEIDREGPHYAVDTMELLSENHPGKKLVYLIGSDSLQDFPTWHRPADLLASISALAVMKRPSSSPEMKELEKKLPGLKAKLKFIVTPLLEISSRRIRRRAREGGPYRYYLPEKVFEYIQKNRVYQ